ncbi:MAG: hypothetical protein HYZ49_00805 [Chloroflexi bacterium]|nr:hypothetical protein [Chloroflexota bacterium]
MNRPRHFSLLIAVLSGWLAAACQPAASTPAPLPTVTPPPPPPTSVAATPSPDVIVRPDQFNQPITIRLGQSFVISSPDPSSEWQVEFDPDLFESPTPTEAGWRFKAVAAGQGLIVLTSVVTCNQPQPCPLMPQRLELTVEVK